MAIASSDLIASTPHHSGHAVRLTGREAHFIDAPARTHFGSKVGLAIVSLRRD